MSSKKLFLVMLAYLAYSAWWAWEFDDSRFLSLAPVFLTAPALFRWSEDYLFPPQKRQIVAQGVTARGFTVVDEKGSERMVLGWAFADSGPHIELRDKEGNTRVKISVEENGSVHLDLFPPEDNVSVASLRVQDGKGNFSADRVSSKVLNAERTSSEYLRYETVVPWPPDPFDPFSRADSFDPDPFLSVEDEDESED
jgi:hypothetical protein